MKDYIILVKNLAGQPWYLHDASFYEFDAARDFARELIDAGVFFSVSIGEYSQDSNDPPTFNYTYVAK